MRQEPSQPEFFGEFKKVGQKKFQKSTILPKGYTLFNVSYEQIIFIAIAVIMLMVLLFSLGVEYGKYIARPGEAGAQAPKPQKQAKEAAAPQPAKEELKPPSAAPTPEIKEPQPAAQEEAKKAARSQKFTIQIVAYRSKKLAQDEMVALSKKGFSPFIVIGDGYYQVCAGEYAVKEEAAKDYEKLKKLHKDCFIRKR